MHLVIFFSILAWFSEISRLYFVSSAMGLSLNFGLVTFAALSNALLTILPLAGLGFAELGIAELLSQSVSKGDAGLIIILDRAISYLSVVVIGSVDSGKARLAVGVTKNNTDRISAGDIIKPIATMVGGNGGGRSDFAQAGGSKTKILNDRSQGFVLEGEMDNSRMRVPGLLSFDQIRFIMGTIRQQQP
mgnify:CR=1 FL=1